MDEQKNFILWRFWHHVNSKLNFDLTAETKSWKFFTWNFFLAQVFDTIRNSKNSSYLHKIILICGDITIDGLELSTHDEALLINEVNIIFHCAANVRFNDSLRDAININVIGTLRMAQLAQKMKNFSVFSYMSTAFSQSYQLDLEEKYYPTNLDIHKLIKNTQEMNEQNLSELEADL